MNWDITMGTLRQWYGRALQSIGTRFQSRDLVMNGERAEYAGRLQVRYGWLKHQAQWSVHPARWQRAPIAAPTARDVAPD